MPLSRKMPSFLSSVTDAFAEMTSLESPNDFFVSSFVNGSEQLELFAKGRGGLAKVKEILTQNFESEVAVAMFRVTAVDDRGKVKSFRTKLVHVVYIGPKTPVMKRAKIGPWNSALKQPFTMNLSIQTDDVDGDLSEASLERSLRASGGAHQPTSFDFSNAEGGSGALESSMTLPSPKASPPASPSNAPRSPGGNRSFLTTWNEHNKAFHQRDVDGIRRQYAEDFSKLIFTDASTGSVAISEGPDSIGEAMKNIFENYREDIEIIKVEKTQPDAEHSSEGIVFCYWTSEHGAVSGFDTLCIVGGKVVVHTLAIHRVSVAAVEDQVDASSQATAEFEDTAASNRADAGDVPSQEAASEQPDFVSQEDDFVEVEQPPISVGEPSTEGASEMMDSTEAEQIPHPDDDEDAPPEPAGDEDSPEVEHSHGDEEEGEPEEEQQKGEESSEQPDNDAFAADTA